MEVYSICPGARIMVHMKTGMHFAWATNQTEFEAALQARNVEPKRVALMRYFLAMHAFTVSYPHHQSLVRYPEDTPLYAFPNPEDGLVRKLHTPPSTLMQGRLL